jgi:hypothetical protein
LPNYRSAVVPAAETSPGQTRPNFPAGPGRFGCWTLFIALPSVRYRSNHKMVLLATISLQKRYGHSNLSVLWMFVPSRPKPGKTRKVSQIFFFPVFPGFSGSVTYHFVLRSIRRCGSEAACPHPPDYSLLHRFTHFYSLCLLLLREHRNSKMKSSRFLYAGLFSFIHFYPAMPLARTGTLRGGSARAASALPASSGKHLPRRAVAQSRFCQEMFVVLRRELSRNSQPPKPLQSRNVRLYQGMSGNESNLVRRQEKSGNSSQLNSL